MPPFEGERTEAYHTATVPLDENTGPTSAAIDAIRLYGLLSYLHSFVPTKTKNSAPEIDQSNEVRTFLRFPRGDERELVIKAPQSHPREIVDLTAGMLPALIK